ncbi:MAG: endonuclease III [Candidatus Micrarchaeota archaeon]
MLTLKHRVKHAPPAVSVLRTLARFHRGSLSHLGRVKRNSRSGLAFKVLVGTILSHRTKDAKTEIATNALLAALSTPAAIAAAPIAKIRQLIKPAGFYNSKARYLKECCSQLVARFGGAVPRSMEELTSLPGVGRKTAGCVLAYAFNLPAIPVDSHVHRVSNRLGIVSTRTPEETEMALMRALPRSLWVQVNELLVLHGQTVCVPISPRCSACPLDRECPKKGVKARR